MILHQTFFCAFFIVLWTAKHTRSNIFPAIVFALFHFFSMFLFARNRLLRATLVIERIRTRTALWTIVLAGAFVFAKSQAIVAVVFASHFSGAS